MHRESQRKDSVSTSGQEQGNSNGSSRSQSSEHMATLRSSRRNHWQNNRYHCAVCNVSSTQSMNHEMVRKDLQGHDGQDSGRCCQDELHARRTSPRQLQRRKAPSRTRARRCEHGHPELSSCRSSIPCFSCR